MNGRRVVALIVAMVIVTVAATAILMSRRTSGTQPSSSNVEGASPTALTPRTIDSIASTSTSSPTGSIDNHFCTQIGCRNAVTVDLTVLPEEVRGAATTATVCANDQCENVTIWPGMQGASVKISEQVVRTASIRMTNAEGSELANLKLTSPQEAVEAHPNGPDCAPTCWLLNLTPKDGALARSDRQFGTPTTSR